MSLNRSLFKLTLICLLLAMAMPAAADPSYDLVESKMSEVRFVNLMNTVQDMEDFGTRFVGSVNAPLVRDYISSRLQGYGWDVTIQEFELTDPLFHEIGDVDRSWNVIARREGYDPDALIILGSHWDSIDDMGTTNYSEHPEDAYDGSYANPETPAPGANDNGTGVATLLEIARVLGDHPFRQDVEIVFFGSEEWGVQGSKYYLSQIPEEVNIGGFFNVDSIGFDLVDPIDLAVYYYYHNEWLANFAVNWGNEYAAELDNMIFEKYEYVGIPGMANSDAAPFWDSDRNPPAVSFWEGNDHAPHYNNADDTISNCIDYLFFDLTARFVMAVFCEWGYIYDPIPVALSFFDLAPLPGAVQLTWAAEDGYANEFRLEASQGVDQWQPNYRQDTPGNYSAYDDSPLLAAGGEVEYKLYGRETGEEWLLLHRETVQVEGITPAMAPSIALWPNPGNPNFRVRLQMPKTGPAAVEVFDLSGRRLTTLHHGDLAAGPHELTWPGTDERGRELASGIYLVNLKTASGSVTQRAVLLR